MKLHNSQTTVAFGIRRPLGVRVVWGVARFRNLQQLLVFLLSKKFGIAGGANGDGVGSPQHATPWEGGQRRAAARHARRPHSVMMNAGWVLRGPAAQAPGWETQPQG